MERNHPSPPPPSATQSSAEFNSSLESAARRAEVFRELVEEVESGRLDGTSLSLRLQEVGASPEEAKNYLEQLRGNLGQRQNRASPENPADGPENQTEPVAFEQTPIPLSDVRNWMKLVEAVGEGRVNQLLMALADPRSADVLIEAPHLQEYKPTQGESHLERIWKLRQSYTTTENDILLDEFEKLYAGLDGDYHHDDEPKNFGGGDHFRARKPVQMMRVAPIQMWEF